MMLLAILSNMGIDITALVASLGVGGIAIALAIQTVLSDVFASWRLALISLLSTAILSYLAILPALLSILA